MNRRAPIVIGIAVVLFVLIGGVIVARSIGGGGQARFIDLAITGSSMEPKEPVARQGDRITMSVTADRKEEIHLHGYDIIFEAEPGKKVTKTFTADKTGRYEIEIESSSTAVGTFTVNP